MGRVLCQPDGRKSCGACCGMYNHKDHLAEETEARIFARTLAYRREAKIAEPETLEAFREKYEDGPAEKLLSQLPSCPFLGFITVKEPGDRPGRVGCLVHPLQNEGVDGRDCGVYDRFICEEYLCAAHEVLREKEMDFVIGAVQDSYLYGLAITNPRFVKSLLALVADLTGFEPAAKILSAPEVLQEARHCFETLRDWPYGDEDGIFGAVKVAGPLDTRRREMPDLQGRGVDHYDRLLNCLGTKADSFALWEEARALLKPRVEKLADAVVRSLS